MEAQQPKLRFSEFKGKWTSKSIGSIASFFSGGTPTSTNKSYYEGTIPFIGSGKIDSNYVDQFITEEALNNSSSKMVEVGDLLYAMYGATSGEVAISKINGAINQAVLCIRTNENKIFLKSWFQKSKDSILKTYLQGGQGNLSAQIVKSLTLHLPSLLEQTKIANFLSAVDERLNLLKEKKSLLEDYKKGIMQKIFNQEIRFKDDDGNDFEDWEEKSLREITTLITKGTTPKSFVNDGVNYVKIECIEGRSLNLKKCLFIDLETHNNELKRSVLKENDILFAIAGSIGKSIIIKKNHLPANTNQALSIIRLKEGVVLDFVFQVLNSEQIQKYIKDNITVGAQPNLNLEQIGSYTFYCPRSIIEQTKIANFLSAIDEKIELVSNQIQDTQEYKRGLLQQMFV